MMTRLSHSALMRAHRFMVEIHALGDLTVKSRAIPAGLAQLVACDRAAINEMDLVAKQVITPHPVPAYWAKLGPVLQAHLHEHEMFGQEARLENHRVVTFGNRRHDPRWKKSMLYNEYYLKAGAQQQAGNFVFRETERGLFLNCNRWGRDFSAAERMVLELVSPHIGFAWRNAEQVTRLRRLEGEGFGNGGGPSQCVLTVDATGRWLGPVPATACERLSPFFGEGVDAGHPVPEALRRWMRAQRERMQSPEALGLPPALFELRLPCAVLIARLGQVLPDSTMLLLEVSRPAPRSGRVESLAGFTPRESEILHWLREGKRNIEIGTILGLSPRTVGKHVEHILEKLGVETRTAAARAAFEIGRGKSP
ncbi:MAG: helix-turn-helix transcriptional regulator [Opitutaceae bacterium]|nr:helix-turn-helix transcriptional regulator [Opitutaceae bacterium]